MQAILGSILLAVLATLGLVSSASQPVVTVTEGMPVESGTPAIVNAVEAPELDASAVQVAIRLSETERFAQYTSRLGSWIADPDTRAELLRTVLDEAQRARLDPHLVLAVIQIESSFRQFAVSSAGARGFMQVMPFWAKELGAAGADLFEMQVNVRFGCDILRHYINLENGDLYQALSRYKGTPGRLDYSKLVIDTWRSWRRGGMSV